MEKPNPYNYPTPHNDLKYRGNPRKNQLSGAVYSHSVIAVFLAIGCIAVSAIAFNYAGSIQLKIGGNGIQLQINRQTK